VADLGLDPETALNLILMLLRGAAYFFAGFALVGLSVYIVFLCLEIFSPQPRAKGTIAELPQPVACAPVAQQSHGLVPTEAPALAEGATVTRGEVLCEGLSRVDFPGVSARQLLGADTRNV
jgi:hypothetical protein